MIIWIASYPKSGNTWLRTLLSAYYYSKDGIFYNELIKEIGQFPEKRHFESFKYDPKSVIGTTYFWIKAQEKINQDKKLRFFKTHNMLGKYKGYPFTDAQNTLGTIYIVRDPRNVITSVKNHNDFETYEKALEFMQNENTVISDYKHLKNFAKTNIINSWRINYQSWLSNNRYRRMTIKYEDLIRNPNQTLRDLVIFVNSICKFNNGIDLKKLENAIQTTTFEKMQNLEKLFNLVIFYI